MMRGARFRLLWLAPVCAAVVALVIAGSPPVVAATLTAQVGPASGSPSLIIAGTGFGTNETITLVGTTNDGRQTLYPEAQSDTMGAFMASLYFDGTVVRVQATGTRSGMRAVAQVNVGSVPNSAQPLPFPGPQYPGVPYPGGPYPGGPFPGQPFPGQPFAPSQPGVPGSGIGVGIGQAVNVSASGFMANERISVWVTAPDAAVVPQPTATANAQGTVTLAAVFPAPGVWQVTLYGLASNNQVINRYDVSGGATNVPGQPYPGQPFPEPAYPGQPYPGQPYPGGQTPTPRYI